MMDSASISELVMKFSHPTEISTGEIEDVLPQLLSCLEQCETADADQESVINLLLGPVMLNTPIDKLEDELFCRALPSAKKYFRNTLSNIDVALKGSINANDIDISLKSLLQRCNTILSKLDETLVHLLSFGRISVTSIPSVPKIVAEVLLESFKHCRDSEKEYGTWFLPIADNLTAMFRKSHEVQTHLFIVLNDILIFNCNYEEELILLIDVVEIIGCIGEIVIGLDVKTMAEQWKGYARLAQTYASFLKPRLDVAQPICFLANDVQTSLLNIAKMDVYEPKLITRTLKVGSFVLKIIIKLCEEYQNYLGDCHMQLLHLLIALNGNCPGALAAIDVPENVACDIESFITVGASPLLAHLIHEKQFKRVFVDSSDILENKPSLFKLGYLLLSVAIMKKLLCGNNEDTQELWLRTEHSIFDVLFHALAYCEGEMCLAVHLSGDVGGELYEVVLTHMSALIMAFATPTEYPRIEKVLLLNLVQAKLWPALVSSDLLCLLARFGNGELCHSMVWYLLNLLESWPKGEKDRPEWVNLKLAVVRLFPLLPDESKIAALNLYPLTVYPTVWATVPLQCLPGTYRQQTITDVVTLAMKHIENFLSSSPNISAYESMIASLNCLSGYTLEESADVKSLCDNVTDLWQYLPTSRLSQQESSCRGVQWLYNFVATLTKASVCLVPHFNNKQLTVVLYCVQNIVVQSDSFCKLSGVSLLKALSTKYLASGPDQRTFCFQIASLFRNLLCDCNPIVSQASLEAFAYFAHVTHHEEVVADTVSTDKSLQINVASYLQNSPTVTSVVPYFNYITVKKHMFKHKCHSPIDDILLTVDDFLIDEEPNETEVNLDDEFNFSQPKKAKVTSDVEEVMLLFDKGLNDLNMLRNNFTAQAYTTPPVKEKLSILIEKLNKLKDLL